MTEKPPETSRCTAIIFIQNTAKTLRDDRDKSVWLTTKVIAPKQNCGVEKSRSKELTSLQQCLPQKPGISFLINEWESYERFIQDITLFWRFNGSNGYLWRNDANGM